MDQTKLFIATVKAVRLQMKSGSGDYPLSGKSKPSTEFSREASKVVSLESTIIS